MHVFFILQARFFCEQLRKIKIDGFFWCCLFVAGRLVTLYRDTGCKIQELLQPMSPIRISSQQSMAGFSGFYPCFQWTDFGASNGAKRQPFSCRLFFSTLNPWGQSAYKDFIVGFKVNPRRNATALSVFSRRGSKKSYITWLLKLNTTKPGDGHSGGNMHPKASFSLTNSFFLHLLMVLKEHLCGFYPCSYYTGCFKGISILDEHDPIIVTKLHTHPW